MDINASDKGSSKKQGGFLQNILDTLFNSHTPEAENRRRLKGIAKDFSKTKYHSFYKASSGEMLPQFAKLFYDIYKVVFPAQNYLKSITNKNVYKSQAINFSLSDNQIAILDRLDEQKIMEMTKQIPLASIKAKVNSDLEMMNAEFDSQRITRAENLYKAYVAFNDFCTFDFYFMLKKFCSSLKEGVFTDNPAFEKINAEYVVEDLQDLITIIYSIPSDIAWDPFFAMLKTIRGNEMISAGNWKKIITRIKSIQASRSFDMIVRLILKDPKFMPKVEDRSETIVDTYLDKLHEDTMKVITKIEGAQKASKQNDFCMKIFGKTNITQLNYYVSTFNGTLEKKDLSTYEYTDALNYLQEFLVETVKTDLREYSSIVVIRGQWDATLSAPFSNSLQDLISLSSQISELDNSLSEEGPIGMKIKTLLPKIAHDPGAENIINRLVGDANESAKGFIVQATQDFVTIGKLMKQLLEDEQKQKSPLVQNWRELERFSEKPLLQFGIDLYKKIYMFVQLMQTSLQQASF